MKTETVKALPKMLYGVVCEQRVLCGKPSCKCSRGELHRAHYRFWREGGRLRKQYVRRADVEAVRAACAARQAEEEDYRQFKRELAASTRHFNTLLALIREHELLIPKRIRSS